MAQKQWDQVAEDEANALAKLLATQGRSVMVIVVGVDNDADGTCHMTHGVAGETTAAHLRSFIFAVNHKLEWLRAKLVRPA